MKGLSLRQPWPWAIFDLPPEIRKDLENRTWEPPPKIIGKRILIHVGKQWDEEDVHETAKEIIELVREHGYEPPRITLRMLQADLGCIVGAVTVTGFVRRSDSPWFSGPVGWTLSDPVRCDPILCRGAQGLWRVPDDVAEQIRNRAALGVVGGERG